MILERTSLSVEVVESCWQTLEIQSVMVVLHTTVCD